MKVGIREYNEGMEVEVIKRSDGRLCLVAYNEAGFRSVHLDLEDIIKYVAEVIGRAGCTVVDTNAYSAVMEYLNGV